MNKRVISIAYALVIAASAAVIGNVAQAAPYDVADQTCGLLGSPITQVPVQDPVIKQAIEWIQKRNGKSTEHKLQPKPDSVSQRDGASKRVLILGGPEVVPM